MTTAGQQPAPHPPAEPTMPIFPRHFYVSGAVAVVVLGLGLLGFAMTTYTQTQSSLYWVIAVPIVGVVCIWHSWMNTRGRPAMWSLIRSQVLHWLGVIVANKLLFLLVATGDVNNQAAGLMALLLLALGCFLAGVHFDWVFMPVGVLLGVSVAVAGYADQYMWLILLSIGLALILLLGLSQIGRTKQPAQ